MRVDEAELRACVGRSRSVEDVLDPFPSRALAAALDREVLPGEGDPLPLYRHHLHFHEPVRASDTGPDGHERLGRFLPDLGEVRRMWAGGRVRFLAPLFLGSRARRTSTITAAQAKEGRSGRLVFVTVEHRYEGPDGRVAVVEEQDVVYREPRPLAAQPQPFEPPSVLARREHRPDAVLLFRYSALTYNGHRIHYDRDYVREVEGYPDLVVHGPLLATFLLDLAADTFGAERIAGFTFRNRSPLFVDRSLAVVLGRADGDAVPAWVLGEDGRLAVEASITLSGEAARAA